MNRPAPWILGTLILLAVIVASIFLASRHHGVQAGTFQAEYKEAEKKDSIVTSTVATIQESRSRISAVISNAGAKIKRIKATTPEIRSIPDTLKDTVIATQDTEIAALEADSAAQAQIIAVSEAGRAANLAAADTIAHKADSAVAAARIATSDLILGGTGCGLVGAGIVIGGTAGTGAIVLGIGALTYAALHHLFFNKE